jgi:hypothetical protein
MYLTAFDFRYNTREVLDVERRDLAIQQVSGKRPTGINVKNGRRRKEEAVTANHGSEISAFLVCALRGAANAAHTMPARSVAEARA